MPDLSFLVGWAKYPISETFHFLQGVLCGWLGARAIFRREVSDALVSMLIAFCFATYEITEQWKVNDSAYEDFENFLVAALATGCIYAILHLYRQWKNFT